MQSQGPGLKRNGPEAHLKTAGICRLFFDRQGYTVTLLRLTSLGSRGGKSSLKKVSASSICALRCFWMKLSKSRLIRGP